MYCKISQKLLLFFSWYSVPHPRVIVRGNGFTVGFDKASGYIDGYDTEDGQLLVGGPVFSPMRATINNDRKRVDELLLFFDMPTTVGPFEVTADEKVVTIIVDKRLATNLTEAMVEKMKIPAPDTEIGFDVIETTRVLTDGTVELTSKVTPFGPLPDLVRIGYEMIAPSWCERFTWYGRGPHESYVDRKQSAALGLYAGTVDEQFVNYPYPQENGNTTDVRWLTVAVDDGVGIRIEGMQPLSASVRHYTTENLNDAGHPYDLERIDETVISVDYRQGPLGNASCGPKPLEFRQPDKPTRQSVVHHSINGKFAIRDGRWKLVLCPGSGGWTQPDREAVTEGLPLVQLYDMRSVPSETANLYKQEPERVRSMLQLLQHDVEQGRSTPGTAQANDVPVDVWKLDTMPGADTSLVDDYS